MFISKSERMEISQRLYVLEEMVKSMGERLRAVEVTTNEIVNNDKKSLAARAEKLLRKNQLQRKYNADYRARQKAKKEAARAQAEQVQE